MVVAQLIEQLLPIPEVHGLNPVIGKILLKFNICLLSNVYWKDKNKKRGLGWAIFKKKVIHMIERDNYPNRTNTNVYIGCTIIS